jgi:hypothetical protein
MITTFIIQLVAGLVSGILGLVPDWSIDMSAVTSFTGTIGSLAGAANGYVPSLLLFSCIGIILALRLVLLAVRAVLFAYTMIPFN